MTAEFIKIERTITKRSYGLDWKDTLIRIYGSELDGHDLSPEFKNLLWEDMSIDIEELMGEGDKEDVLNELLIPQIDWDRENELCAKRILYRELMKKSEIMSDNDKELLVVLSRGKDLKSLVDYYSKNYGEKL